MNNFWVLGSGNSKWHSTGKEGICPVCFHAIVQSNEDICIFARSNFELTLLVWQRRKSLATRLVLTKFRRYMDTNDIDILKA